MDDYNWLFDTGWSNAGNLTKVVRRASRDLTLWNVLCCAVNCIVLSRGKRKRKVRGDCSPFICKHLKAYFPQKAWDWLIISNGSRFRLCLFMVATHYHRSSARVRKSDDHKASAGIAGIAKVATKRAAEGRCACWLAVVGFTRVIFNKQLQPSPFLHYSTYTDVCPPPQNPLLLYWY